MKGEEKKEIDKEERLNGQCPGLVAYWPLRFHLKTLLGLGGGEGRKKKKKKTTDRGLWPPGEQEIETGLVGQGPQSSSSGMFLLEARMQRELVPCYLISLPGSYSEKV